VSDDTTRVQLGHAVLELTQGDITRQDDCDAVVNAANAELLPGGGVAGAIHRAAGPALAEAATKFAPLRPGQAVVTGAFNLPNRYVIHCLGPVYGVDQPAEELLSSCYRSVLALAERRKLGSVAFPAISTGAFGYPMRAAAEVALRTVLATLPSLSVVRRVRFVLYDREALEVHRELLDGLINPPAA
jgi:O-acetyl-ADP-ribose deacetylase